MALIDNIFGNNNFGTEQSACGTAIFSAVTGRVFVAKTPEVFTYDADGNICEYVSAADGTVAAHYDYSPFGETLVASGPLASSLTHRFSTKPYCQTTGFCEYQMRKYRPDIGRWMSRDPMTERLDFPMPNRTFGNDLGFMPNINVFSFVDNSPSLEYDFLGLEGNGRKRHEYPEMPVDKQSCTPDQTRVIHAAVAKLQSMINETVGRSKFVDCLNCKGITGVSSKKLQTMLYDKTLKEIHCAKSCREGLWGFVCIPDRYPKLYECSSNTKTGVVYLCPLATSSTQDNLVLTLLHELLHVAGMENEDKVHAAEACLRLPTSESAPSEPPTCGSGSEAGGCSSCY